MDLLSTSRLFEQFLARRRYLKNVTPSTIEWYETAFKALQREHGADPRTDRPWTVQASRLSTLFHSILRTAQFISAVGMGGQGGRRGRLRRFGRRCPADVGRSSLIGVPKPWDSKICLRRDIDVGEAAAALDSPSRVSMLLVSLLNFEDVVV